MFKYILLAAAWMLPFAAAHAQTATSWDAIVKESIDATQIIDDPELPDGAAAPSDLTLDTDFMDTGMVTIYPIPTPPNATTIEDGLRVFPYTECSPPPAMLCSHRGYYVVGRVKNTDGTWRSAITRRKADGTLDLAFGTVGWMYPSLTQTDIADAAMGNGRMYILSTIEIGSVPVMRVSCTELANGNSCFAGFGGTVTFGATASGAVRGAHARRIAYDSRYGIFIAGRVQTVARGWEIGVANLDADSGALKTSFHGTGTNTGLPSWAAQTDADIDVFDMTVVPSGTPGGARLYVAGTIKRDVADYDGFVLGLDPISGYSSAGWGWKALNYEADNFFLKKDAITAITVQRNGRLAMAGWSETNTAGERSMILARHNADGLPDASFCDGGGICKRNDPWPNVVDDDLPTAIAERSGNRDLVIALKHRRPAASDPRPRQVVVQYGATGNVKHAQRTLDYPAAGGVTAWSRPFGMWVGNIAPLFSPENEVVVVVGTRLYDPTDYDATLSQMFANDSIFAGQFGTSKSD